MRPNIYKILFTKDAAKYYNRCDVPTKQKLERCFETLRRRPFDGANISRLHGELSGLHRYKAGSLRIVYKIEAEQVTVIIIAIGSRGDMYK
jgi:mRNA interferase RelE/StbE